jgi:peroxiredoxin
MHSIDWQLAAAIATVFSSAAFAISAIAVMLQLRQMARERYFSVTAHLFEIWQSSEFQRDQLFLLHEMPQTNWESFCAPGRGKRAERALHRVGGYYDRVGNLVRHNLIRKEEILPTIGGNAVAVWHRIQPLVKELRLRENAVLFENYESLLPECHDCYVPALAHPLEARPLSSQGLAKSAQSSTHIALSPIVPATTAQFSTPNGASTVDENASAAPNSTPTTEVIWANTVADGQNPVAPDFSLPDSDGVMRHLSDFVAEGAAAVVYFRGAWCPFCLRQLSDYADLYAEFKRSGVEVVAVSCESRRICRRARSGLKLPFPVLSDVNWDAARGLGLEVEKGYNNPTPATFIIDQQRRIRFVALDRSRKSLFARQLLEYARALNRESPSPLPPPQVEAAVKPGLLFFRSFMNMALAFVSR